MLPQFFSMFFAVARTYAFRDCKDDDVYFRFRTNGKFFDLIRFKAKPKTFQSVIRELLTM